MNMLMYWRCVNRPLVHTDGGAQGPIGGSVALLAASRVTNSMMTNALARTIRALSFLVIVFLVPGAGVALGALTWRARPLGLTPAIVSLPR